MQALKESDPNGYEYLQILQGVHDHYNGKRYVSDLPDQDRHFLFSAFHATPMPEPHIPLAFEELASNLEGSSQPRDVALAHRTAALHQLYDHESGTTRHASSEICQTAFGFNPRELIEKAPVSEKELDAYYSRAYDCIPIRVLKKPPQDPDGKELSNSAFVSEATGEPVKQDYLKDPELIRAKKQQYLNELTFTDVEKHGPQLAEKAKDIIMGRVQELGLTLPDVEVSVDHDKKPGYAYFFTFVPPPGKSKLVIYPSTHLSAHRLLEGICHELGHGLHLPYQYNFYQRDGESEYAVYDAVTPPLSEGIATNMRPLLFPDTDSFTKAAMELYRITGQTVDPKELQNYYDHVFYSPATDADFSTGVRLAWQRFLDYEEVEHQDIGGDGMTAIDKFKAAAIKSLIVDKDIKQELREFRYLRHYIFGYSAYRAFVAQQLQGKDTPGKAEAILELCQQRPRQITQEELTGFLKAA